MHLSCSSRLPGSLRIFPAGSGLARRAAERFLAATLGGDLGNLMEVLAPDVALWTDGGGAVRAALRPVTRAAKVAKETGR